jgi:hypothetical protein
MDGKGIFLEKTMKKDLYFLLLFLLIFSACGEESPVPNSNLYIKFKVDGQEIFYQANALSPSLLNYDSNHKVYNAALQVIAPGSNGTKDFINILIRSETKIQTNLNYRLSDGIQIGAFTQPKILFTYADEKGDIYNAVILKESYPNLDIKDEAELTFTKIGDGIMEGIFSAILIGPVSSTTGRGTGIKTISQGEFRLGYVESNS